VKEFGDSPAVDSIDLVVEPGTFCALIGPSGCGKTTTLRLISGMETPTSGQVLLNGNDVTYVSPRNRKTPLVWQSFALFPHLTVRGNVEFGLRMSGVDSGERRSRAMKLLEYMGLAEMENRPVVTLSGGQRQRVGLARALVMETGILLLDEPLGSLDANLRIVMQSELKKLQRELQLTFVYVTHNQNEALAMADQIVVMNDGHIEQGGSASDVYLRPATQFVAEFVGANNIFGAQVITTNGTHMEVETEIGRFKIASGLGAPDGSERHRAGSAISFVVQASRLRLSTGNGQNVLRGKVITHEFSGALVTTFVELDDGRLLKLQRPEIEVMGREEAPDEMISLTWRPEDVHILPEDR